jgi:hypothetical protein
MPNQYRGLRKKVDCSPSLSDLVYKYLDCLWFSEEIGRTFLFVWEFELGTDESGNLRSCLTLLPSALNLNLLELCQTFTLPRLVEGLAKLIRKF